MRMSKVVNDDASDEEDEVEHVYDETSAFLTSSSKST